MLSTKVYRELGVQRKSRKDFQTIVVLLFLLLFGFIGFARAQESTGEGNGDLFDDDFTPPDDVIGGPTDPVSDLGGVTNIINLNDNGEYRSCCS